MLTKSHLMQKLFCFLTGAWIICSSAQALAQTRSSSGAPASPANTAKSKTATLAPSRAPANLSISTAQASSVNAFGPRFRFGFRYNPGFSGLSQTISRDGTKFGVSTFSLQNFSAMMAARLTREVVLALDLTYATVETNSVSSDRFEILHSKVSGISPRMTLSYCSLSTKTSFFCPSLGLLVDHVYSLSYVDNTTLGLKKLDDIMAHIGVAYRLGLGPRLFTTTQLSYERGIGLLNSEQTRWVKHENIKGSVTLSIPLNRALLLAFGGIVNFRNSAYSINADQWSQRETAFGGLVGFTYLLGAGPVPKIHARQPVKPAPPVIPRAPAAIPF